MISAPNYHMVLQPYGLQSARLLCSWDYRPEDWSGLPYPPPGDLPYPEIEPKSLVAPALVGRFFTTSATWEALPIVISR